MEHCSFSILPPIPRFCQKSPSSGYPIQTLYELLLNTCLVPISAHLVWSDHYIWCRIQIMKLPTLYLSPSCHLLFLSKVCASALCCQILLSFVASIMQTHSTQHAKLYFKSVFQSGFPTRCVHILNCYCICYCDCCSSLNDADCSSLYRACSLKWSHPIESTKLPKAVLPHNYW
jgi:hypothetical protein